MNKKFFIDTENVGFPDLEKYVKDGDNAEFFVFHNERFTPPVRDSRYNFVRVLPEGRKNALDFVLCSYVGAQIQLCGSNSVYYIISNDKGYDVVTEFWCDEGYSIRRVGMPLGEKAFTTKLPTVADTYKVAKNLEVNKEEKLEYDDLASVVGSSQLDVCVSQYNNLNRNKGDFDKKVDNIIKTNFGDYDNVIRGAVKRYLYDTDNDSTNIASKEPSDNHLGLGVCEKDYSKCLKQCMKINNKGNKTKKLTKIRHIVDANIVSKYGKNKSDLVYEYIAGFVA